MAGHGAVVVEGYHVDGNVVAVTLSNPGSSPNSGRLVLMVALADGSAEQVAVRFSLDPGDTETYVTSFDSDVTGATEHGIIDDGNPM